MEQIGKTVTLSRYTVNSNQEDIPTVNSMGPSKKIEDFLGDLVFSNEDVAQTLAKTLNDNKSLSYYQILAQNYPHQRLLEALSYVKDAETRGMVRYKPAYYMAILRKWGFKLKFKR